VLIEKERVGDLKNAGDQKKGAASGMSRGTCSGKKRDRGPSYGQAKTTARHSEVKSFTIRRIRSGGGPKNGPLPVGDWSSEWRGRIRSSISE